MRAVNGLLVARCIVFGLFVVCNAITCSVAAWNFGLVRPTKPLHIDIYLIILGAFSLSSIFILIFVELLCVDPFTTRVWFECVWVTLFWVMQLAGGAALIAVESDLRCWYTSITSVDAICNSERVLLAFTWTCTITLLLYLLALVYIAASQHHEDINIWASNVRSLRVAAVRHYSSAAPHASTVTRFKKHASVDLPPLRSQRTQKYFGGLGPEYKIEPFRTMFVAPQQMDIPHSSSLPEAIPLPPMAATPTKPSSLPRDVVNVDTPQSIAYTNSSLPSVSVPRQSDSLPVPSPSPLGDWPRQDVMKQFVRPKHKSLPPSAFELPKSHTTTVGSIDGPLDAVTQSRPRRPSGPRMWVPSGESVGIGRRR